MVEEGSTKGEIPGWDDEDKVVVLGEKLTDEQRKGLKQYCPGLVMFSGGSLGKLD